jgi:hypothetical protein
MGVLRGKKLSIRRKALIAVAAAYFLVTTGIDLFHDECCEQGQLGEQPAKRIVHNAPCSACAFKAGSNSTSPMCQPVVVVPQVPVVCQPVPRQAPTIRTQWLHSIVLRAPPTS